MLQRVIRINLLLVFVSFNVISHGQNLGLDWGFGLGDGQGGDDQSYTMVSDSQGNVYVAGIFRGYIDFDPSIAKQQLLTSTGSDDGYFAKYDSTGNLIWVKQLKSESSMQINEIIIDHRGNILLAGYYSNRIDFDPSPDTSYAYSGTINNANGFVAKYSSHGEYIWGLNVGGNSVDNVTCLTTDDLGNVFIAGGFSDTVDFDPGTGVNQQIAPSFQDVFIAKYDSSGNHSWAFSINASASDYAQRIALDSKGDIVVVGTFSNTTDFDPSSGTASLSPNGRNDAFIAKYSSSGTYQWAKTIGGSGNEYAYGLQVSTTDHIYIAGTFESTADFDPSSATATISSNGRADIYFAKYQSNGSYVWAKGIGTSSNELVNSLALDMNGNSYIAGYFVAQTDFDPSSSTANRTPNNGDIFIAKYDSLGRYSWVSQIGDRNFENALCITTDPFGKLYSGGYFVDEVDFDPDTTSTRILRTPDSRNESSFIARYSQQNGSYDTAWTVTDRTGGEDEAQDLEHDSQGNLYVTGYFQGKVDFDPDTSTAELTSTGGYDIFVAKYDSTGKYVWAFNIGSSSNEVAYDIEMDQYDNFYITGYFIDTLDLDPSSSTANITGNGSTDIFIVKYNSKGQYQWGYGLGGVSTDVGYGLTTDDDFNIWLTGYFRSTVDFDPSSGTTNLTARNRDIFLTKFDSSGSFKLAKFIGGSSNNFGYALSTGSNNCVYLTGEYRNTCDFDPSSSVVNLRTSGTADPFIAKYDSIGNYIWAIGFDGSGADRPSDIGIDDAENLYIVGQFQSSNDFDPSSATATLTSGGGDDAFVASYDSSGAYRWAHSFGSNTTRVDRALAIDIEENVLNITGYFGDTVDFNPSATMDSILIASTADNPFILKLDTGGSFVQVGHVKCLRGYGYGISSFGTKTYLGGSFQNNADLSLGFTPNSTIQSNGDDDIFIAQYGFESRCKSTADTVDIDICGPYTSPSKRAVYSRTGTYIDTLVNSSGCDSFLYINLTIRNSFDTLTQTVCDSFITPSGRVLYQTGTYVDTLTNSASCDSLITILLNVSNDSTKVNVAGCDSFISPSGKHIYRSSGTYYDTLINQFSCDSIIEVKLTLYQTAYDTIDAKTCDSFTSPSGRYTYVNSGSYMDTLQTQHGCDSVILIRLDVYSSKRDTIHPKLCDSFVSPSLKYTYTQTGIYSDTLQTSNGCDSVISIDLTIFKTTYDTISLQVCDSFISPSGRNIYRKSGSYLDTIVNQSGCDSIISIQLSVGQSKYSKVNVSSCDSFISPSGRSVYYTTGVFNDTLQTNSGCDSIIEISLTISKSKTSSVQVTACDSISTPSGRFIITQSGNYHDTLTTSSGCDSILTIQATIYSSKYTTINPVVCDSLISPDGKQTWYQTGTYFDTLSTSNGCDSIIEVRLTVNQSSFSAVRLAACDSLRSPSGRNTYTSSGIYYDTLLNTAGCDSVIRADVTINQTKFVQASLTACDSILSPSGKRWFTSTGTYSDTVLSSSGCDSVMTLTVTIYQTARTRIDTASCSSITSPSGRYTYSSTGIYVDTIPLSNGCDSIITMNYERLQSTSSTLDVRECKSYTSPSGRFTYKTSGTYLDTIVNMAGCDSFVTIRVTILEPITSNIDVTACDEYITPSGRQRLFQSGLFQDTLMSAQGCDSILIINLTVINNNPVISVSTNTLSVDLSGLTYQWHDCTNGFAPIDTAKSQSYNPTLDGTYSVVVTEEGCSDTADCVNIQLINTTEVKRPVVALYPNPVHSELFISSPVHIERINVYGSSGKLVKSVSNQTVVNVSDLVPTVYFVQIITSHGVVRKSIIKE